MIKHRPLTFRSLVALAFGAFCTVSNLATAPLALANDIRIEGCEFYIDKAVIEAVATQPSSKPIFFGRVYLKLDLARFPADVVSKIGWLGDRTTVLSDGRREVETGVTAELSKFAGDVPDYFVHDLAGLAFGDAVPGGEPARRTEHRGVYFVETVGGDMHWLNEGQRPFASFEFAEAFEGELRAAGQTVGPAGVGALPSLTGAKRTADFLPRLNPKGCR